MVLIQTLLFVRKKQIETLQIWINPTNNLSLIAKCPFLLEFLELAIAGCGI